VARLGSFSAAARELGLAPSVITKRITRLEEEVNTRLIVRSTRGLTLTPAGERLLPRFQRVIAELDELLVDTPVVNGEIEGHLRVKGPTTITSLYLGAVLTDFQLAHPRVTLDVALFDRSVNPLEENFDLVIGARPASFPNVVDIPLCTYTQVLCCAPSYLQAKPEPKSPGDLVDHDCMTTVLFGSTWPFETPSGALSVEVRSRLHANDGRVILEGARRGLGVAILPRYLADADIKDGRLVALLEGFPVETYWLKALVPRIRMERPAVRELVAFLKARAQATPP
jgi:DNA-binding transcriptional LysR family regulator